MRKSYWHPSVGLTRDFILGNLKSGILSLPQNSYKKKEYPISTLSFSELSRMFECQVDGLDSSRKQLSATSIYMSKIFISFFFGFVPIHKNVSSLKLLSYKLNIIQQHPTYFLAP